MAITTIKFGAAGTIGSGIPSMGGLSKSEVTDMDTGNGTSIDANIQIAECTMEGALTDAQIDAGNYDLNTNLTPNFKIKDMCKKGKSNPGANYALYDKVRISEKQLIKNMRNFAVNVLEPLVKHFGKNRVHISNAHRSKPLKVGAGAGSQHLQGQAADLNIDGDIIKNAATCCKILPSWSQIIIEYFPGSAIIHIGWGNMYAGTVKANSREILTSFNAGSNCLNGLYTRNKTLAFGPSSLGGVGRGARRSDQYAIV